MSEQNIQQRPIIAFGVNNIGCDQRGATFQTIVPSTGSTTAKVTKPKFPFITIPYLTDSIISMILSYLQGKSPSQAKDVMKPIRAAQDAGAIRRITFEEMQLAFPDYCPNSKASVSKYTKEDETPYIDEAFKAMVEDFRSLLNNQRNNENNDGK